ncbi:HPr kinase/phosphatase C-terminal domain-containing protein [Tardiphaga sp.]|uniref:HPr kinase/phosphorylase n=1 Tax=Tardiphaga sp. TaxID=1926292 RepID=UPI002633E6A3|nr:HPr kinase/phosphatase C-terminal domain-containing protein [Tardiphaga sp.]MDB5619547.1 serine kinase [Tardiphaga sp.]
MSVADKTVHASAVLVGDRAVLIRGPSGAGKSRLVLELIWAGQAGPIDAAMLVGDDRVRLAARDGRLWVRPAQELAGLIEVRGLGIRRLDHAASAIVGLVVDLAAPDAARLPEPRALRTVIDGVELPRIPVGAGFPALPLVLAALTTTEGATSQHSPDDCPKGIGNHISPTIATE